MRALNPSHLGFKRQLLERTRTEMAHELRGVQNKAGELIERRQAFRAVLENTRKKLSSGDSTIHPRIQCTIQGLEDKKAIIQEQELASIEQKLSSIKEKELALNAQYLSVRAASNRIKGLQGKIVTRAKARASTRSADSLLETHGHRSVARKNRAKEMMNSDLGVVQREPLAPFVISENSTLLPASIAGDGSEANVSSGTIERFLEQREAMNLEIDGGGIAFDIGTLHGNVMRVSVREAGDERVFVSLESSASQDQQLLRDHKEGLIGALRRERIECERLTIGERSHHEQRRRK